MAQKRLCELGFPRHFWKAKSCPLNEWHAVFCDVLKGETLQMMK
jgi:hypothetical protein